MFGYKLIKQSDYDKLLINNSKIEVITKEEHVTVATLMPDVYEKIESKVSNTLISSNTSEIEAGYKMGIQHVLKLLRDGYVVQRS